MFLILNMCHSAVSCSVFLKCFSLVPKRVLKQVLEFYPCSEAGIGAASGTYVSEGEG